MKLKDVILNQCDLRNYILGDTVRTCARWSDLHAVNARYHNKCHVAFFSQNTGGKTEHPPEDQAFVSL